MPAEPISASNLDITERFFNSVKISEDDDDGAEDGAGEGKEEIKKEAVEKQIVHNSLNYSCRSITQVEYEQFKQITSSSELGRKPAIARL